MAFLNILPHRWTLLSGVGLLAAAAWGQTTPPVGSGVTVSFENFTGTASGDFGSEVITFQAPGTMDPFGPVTMYATGEGQAISFNFDFPNGDQVFGLGAVSGGGRSVTANVASISGRGRFATASGSFQLTLTCQGDCEGQNGTAFSSPFIAGGSGVFYLPQIRSSNELSANVTSLFASMDNSSGRPAQQQLAITVAVGSQPLQVSAGLDVSECEDLVEGMADLPLSNIDPYQLFYVNVGLHTNGTQPGSTTCSGTVTINGYAPSNGNQGSFSSKDTPAPIATVSVPVSIVVTDKPELVLSKPGIEMVTIYGESASVEQSVSVSNATSGDLPFTTAIGLGSPWLTVTPPSGDAGASPVALTVYADVAEVPQSGNYWGQVVVASPYAGNSPQVLPVAFVAFSPSSFEPSWLSTYGLVFTGVAGTNPPPQTVTVNTLEPTPLTLSTSSTFANGGNNWFSVAASGGFLVYGTPVTETVAMNSAGLAPGIYSGAVRVTVGATTYPLNILLVLKAPSTGATSASTVALSKSSAVVAAGCTPTELLPVMTSPGDTFQVTAAIPVPIQVQVVDNCGTPFTSGSVVASFPLGDPSVNLVSTGGGTWTGTWWPHNTAGGPGVLVVDATEFTPALNGSTGLSGTIAANTSAPIVTPGRVVNAASYAQNNPIAPGSFIAIFGENLASATAISNPLLFPTSLGGTQVYLGDKLLPLQVVSSSQINAIVPYNAPVNAQQQLMVVQNGSVSPSETVVVAPAQPAVFAQDQSGTGAGAILTVSVAKGTVTLNTPSAPAHAGDILEVYCTGLGIVSPSVPAGSAAPASPLSYTTNTVTATLGGQAAQVQFAGLAPGFVGLYQVNVIVPSGLTPGSAVPLVLTDTNASSPAVTAAIQ